MAAHDWACSATTKAQRYFEERSIDERIQVDEVMCLNCGQTAYRWVRSGMLATGSAHLDPAPQTEIKYRVGKEPTGDPPADPAEVDPDSCP